MAVLEQVRIVTADGLSLHLPPGLARDLAWRITEAVNALPKRGLEVCGLLLGDRSGKEFTVNSMIPFPCQYSEGPAFRMSVGELHANLRFAQTLGEVLGIYRSRNDGSLDLDHQDQLVAGLFSRQPIPVLVIRQKKDAPGEGRLLIWGDDSGAGGITSVGNIFPIREWMTTLELPPKPSPKPLNVLPIVRPRAEFRSVPVPKTHLLPVAATRIEASNPVRMAWIAAAAGGVILSLFLGWQLLRLSTTERPPTESKPAAAPLVIAAGPGEVVAGEERFAGREYPRSFQTVRAWIRNRDNATLREIAVGLLARHWKKHPGTLPLLKQAAQADPNPIVRAAAREAIAGGWPSSTKDPAVPKVTASNISNAGAPVKATPRNQPKAAESVGKTQSEPEESAAPRKDSKLRKVAGLFRLPWLRSSTPKQPELPLPAPVQNVETKRAIPALQVPLPALPGQTSRPIQSPASRPPALVRQTTLVNVPPELRRQLRRETVLSLRVRVDAKGRVLSTEPWAPIDNLERSIGRFYADAAKHWVFDPARRDNKPVSGDTILHFRVAPQLGR